jgi:multiple sugar transport system substrate-binding protein
MTRSSLLAGVLGLTFVLAGCSKGIPEDKKVIRFSFWGGYLEMNMWKEMKESFEEANPDVYIKLEYAPGSDKPSTLVTRMLARSAAEVMMIDDDGLPWLASKRYLEPLDERIARDSSELRLADFFPTALDSGSYEGTQWALPYDGFCELIYANLDLFDKAGIPEPTDEWTWEDFGRIAQRLTLDTNGDGVKDQYGAFFILSTHHNQRWMWAYGADWMDPAKTRMTIESPEAVEALHFLGDLLFRKKCVALLGDVAMVEEVMLFTGRVAMVACPGHVMMSLRQIANKRWDVFHMPRGPKGPAARVSWDCIGIYKGAPEEKKELAWKWLKHVLSEHSQRAIGKSGRGMPVRVDDVRASFVRADTPQHEERFLEAMLRYGRTTPQMLATKAWRNEADTIMTRFSIPSSNAWGAALMQGEDPPDESRYRGDPGRWLSPERTVQLCQEACQSVLDDFTKRGY